MADRYPQALREEEVLAHNTNFKPGWLRGSKFCPTARSHNFYYSAGSMTFFVVS
jgi:hypothetical protein